MLALCLVTSLFAASYGYPTLLWATAKDINIANITRGSTKPTTIVRDLQEGAAVDYYYEGGLVCWTEHALEVIQCIEYNGTQPRRQFKVVDEGVITPDGLACDWVTQKLYWTDVETNRIEVVSIDGKNRKVLFWDDIDQPRAIVLVPMRSLMFWTDWGEVPKIERAGMDGSKHSRQVLVSDDIFWPNGLTVDYENHVLYWLDGKLKFIAQVDYEGRNRKKILTDGIEYPYALTFFKDKFYWSDWKTWAIHESNGTTTKKLIASETVPMDLHVYDPQLQPHIDTPCNMNNGGCSHLCLLSPDPPGFKCDCPTGVKLVDNYTCANGSQEFLLIVQHTDICRISLDSPDYTIFKIPLQAIKHAIAIDYDPVEDNIYWTDDGNRGLRKAKLNGTKQENVITTEVQHPDGLAIDWNSRNLYWTDTGTDRIEVARLNGSYRKVLINRDLHEPRAIALSPNHGLMFWSDWYENKPKIERANLDGTDRRTLVSTDLGWPNGIVLDLESELLYWCDARTDKFESIDFDGSDRRVVLSENLFHPFGLSLMGDYLYWTDWTLRTVERINRFTSNDREMIADQFPNLMGLKVVRRGAKITTNPCADNNAGCSHLCLNRPGNNYTCACQIGYELTSDLKTCVIPKAFLLFTKKENIGRISIENNNNEVTIPVSGVKDASVLDFDMSDDRIYWADVKQKTISRAFMNGSDVEKIIEFGLDAPRGLAVDWLSRNLYWTDAGTKRIEVARLNGTYRRTLVWKDIEEPTSLVLDPKAGFMYWSDWGKRGYIGRASMDGSQKVHFVSNVVRASGLTIDYREHYLYWSVSSSKSTIECCSLDDCKKKKIVTENIFRPVSLTLYQDYIYWFDAGSGKIERANKTLGTSRTTIATRVSNVTDILIYHASRQAGWGKCNGNNGKCSHLCLASNDGKETKNKCACSIHYKLDKDNTTCVGPTSFLLFSQKNSIHRLIPDTDDCPDTFLPIQGLKNVKAIAFDPDSKFVFWIDGRWQVIRKSLDTGLKQSSVIVSSSDKKYHLFDLALDPYTRLLYWTCANTHTINVTKIDPSSPSTGGDIIIQNATQRPRNIALHPEKSLLFWTDLGSEHRVMKSYVDGSQTTAIASDLKELSAIAVDRIDDIVFFAQNRQIERCDLEGKQRRVLQEDVDVQSLAVHGEKLYWVDIERSAIMRVVKINGENVEVVSKYTATDLISVKFPTQQHYKQHPCSFNNKNKTCSHICISLPPSSPQQPEVKEVQYFEQTGPWPSFTRRKTNRNKEVEYSRFINTLDKPQIEDEVRGQSVITNTKSVCACPLNQVLHEDKRSCSALPACSAAQFACTGHRSSVNKDCIPIEWRCDGQKDCPDESDEENCPECRSDQFHCLSGQCIDKSWVCDGRSQCPDGSDEAQCCVQGEIPCTTSGKCISVKLLCDGWENCDDRSDEDPVVCGNKYRDTEPVYRDSGLNAYIVVISVSLLAAVVFGIMLSFHWRRKCLGVPDVSIGSAGDPLAPKPFQSSMSKPRVQDSVRMTMLNGSTTSNSYDRNHITGASSSSTSGVCSGVVYPAETLNPPPSPATTTESRHCCNSIGSRYRPYRHYRAINQPPPPTPCSTDICDESDYGYRPQTESEYMTYSRGTASECDSDPFPPPPTPSSCPPSPSSTYFSPLPPPPSPVNRHHH